MGPRLDVQFRLQKRRVDEVRVRGGRLFQLHLGLLEVSSLEICQRQLIVGLREPRLELHDPLKVLDRRGRLALREMHSSTQQKSVEIRWVLLEDNVECLEALVVLPLSQGDLGEAAPGREESRSFLGDLRQDSLALLGLLEREVKVRQLESCRRANRRKLGRRPVLPLGLRDVALRDVEIRERRMRLQGLRLLGHCFLKGALRLRHVLLSHVESPEGYVEPRLVAVVGPYLFKALNCSVYLLRSNRRSRPKE